ncbi:SHC-transforming protein 2 isoform X2 [Anolis sagrei]|uniref:SHC-transforming protein 2 isoform X2 n=1 Tax=Anolis sagrei TaxID=38937 RepID=UPI00295BFC0C|nr:SHC-transforming protein 2 isoform X2 [Anolis sagrei ordinatus]
MIGEPAEWETLGQSRSTLKPLSQTGPGMLAVPKYDRFWNDATTPSETAAMSSKAAAVVASAPGSDPMTSPPGEEQEAGTTFCTLIPKMPQWKFAGPSGFLSRSPSSANKELSASGKTGSGSGLAAVLSACEPVCTTPCSLPVMSRLRGGSGGGRKAPRAEGHKPASDEWSRKGSFISKPVQGWLHPDERVLSPGVSYVVRYMGCIEILRSMRSLDFTTRTQVTKEAINRLYEAVPGVKGTWKKKVPNKALFSILGKSNLHFAGLSIVINISIDGLNLMIPTTRQDTTDYVAYVAKDPINQRACHILECCNGLAQSVISTVGQAFELRFKQYLHSPPKTVTPQERPMGMDEAGWGEEEEASEHDYYNSIPGKEPPLGGLVDSRLQHSASLGNVPFSYSGHFSQVGSPTRRDLSSHANLNWDADSHGLSSDGYVEADGKPLGSQDYEDHMYVNTQNLDNWEADPGGARPLAESPPKDLFDMRPFEDALKLHASMSACGLVSGPPVEDQWPSPPTRKAPIAPTEEQLKQEPWYHGKMSRKDAEKLLLTDGDFLVRDSITNPGQYVLTGMHGGQPKHLLLVDPEGVVRTKDALFESISHLINYHLQNEQPIVAAESELHLRQVVKWKQ